MNQSEVCRLERRSDLLLSTLRKFVEAAGGVSVVGPAVVAGWLIFRQRRGGNGAEATARYRFATGAVGDDAVSDGVAMIASPSVYEGRFLHPGSLSLDAAQRSSRRMDIAGGEVGFLAGPSPFVTGLPLDEPPAGARGVGETSTTKPS
jgi:hypothetical protein